MVLLLFVRMFATVEMFYLLKAKVQINAFAILYATVSLHFIAHVCFVAKIVLVEHVVGKERLGCFRVKVR